MKRPIKKDYLKGYPYSDEGLNKYYEDLEFYVDVLKSGMKNQAISFYEHVYRNNLTGNGFLDISISMDYDVLGKDYDEFIKSYE